MTVEALPDLFPGFETRRIPTPIGAIFARIGGSGPPLVCLHGYPETHVCWHRMAPALAQEHTVILMDLRGYGASFAPEPDADHRTYSKRAMAEDVATVMTALGHERFAVMGHDRGARVAYRLALDQPDRVERLIILDILPTLEVWQRMTAESALKSYHWLFLAQPSPLPETLIGGASVHYVEHTMRSWTRTKTLDCFSSTALEHCRRLLATPEGRRAVCEDYRAGATYDRIADETDRKAGRKITCPTLLLWGSDYIGKGTADPLNVWKTWCTDVEGQEIVSGHFLTQENPEDTLAAVLPFLRARANQGP